MSNITYTIGHPVTGHCDDFETKKEAVKAAKSEDYSPVFIDIYDEEQNDIIGDIRVDNKNVKIIP